MLERIGLVANPGKPGVEDALQQCVRELNERGMTPVLSAELAAAMGMAGTSAAEAELPTMVDAMISLGGDGTFLKSSRLVGEARTPLLGINLGSLGFLTEVRVEEIPEAVRALAEGDYILEKRNKVAAIVRRDGDEPFQTTALNDVVLNMGPMPRVLDIEVVIAQTSVGRYLADGLIVATPTGSTAYSLSAGGPIVDPSMDALLITPISPHTLGVRPLILEHHHLVDVHLLSDSPGVLSADGQVAFEVQSDDRITFRRAPHSAYFIRLPRRDFFKIIQEKLRWGGLRRSLNGTRTSEDVAGAGRRAT